jgi:O-antigen ligase
MVTKQEEDYAEMFVGVVAVSMAFGGFMGVAFLGLGLLFLSVSQAIGLWLFGTVVCCAAVFVPTLRGAEKRLKERREVEND